MSGTQTSDAVPSAPSPLVALLQRFNRKERYWLLADALGYNLSLDKSYREKIKNIIGVDVPEDAWWALDYHFDWLYAALSCAPDFDPVLPDGPRENGTFEASGQTGSSEAIDQSRQITGAQEDIDFLIAFGRTLILVEAKAATGWTHAQMASKARRLKSLDPFLVSSDPKGVQIYFVLTSPKESANLKTGILKTKNKIENWLNEIPSSMRSTGEGNYCFFMELGSFKGKEFLQVERCDNDGKPDRAGENWHIVRSAPND